MTPCRLPTASSTGEAAGMTSLADAVPGDERDAVGRSCRRCSTSHTGAASKTQFPRRIGGACRLSAGSARNALAAGRQLAARLTRERCRCRAGSRSRTSAPACRASVAQESVEHRDPDAAEHERQDRLAVLGLDDRGQLDPGRPGFRRPGAASRCRTGRRSAAARRRSSRRTAAVRRRTGRRPAQTSTNRCRPSAAGRPRRRQAGRQRPAGPARSTPSDRSSTTSAVNAARIATDSPG